ncbi:hypothetical protein GGE24_003089 [Bradyrhizobium centrosematis]|nr:hypothetical protein [Bradyrhizobium centrosematis]MCS3773777.1 hypothetical protein [Bradyrhizobium centrosematis]
MRQGRQGSGKHWRSTWKAQIPLLRFAAANA